MICAAPLTSLNHPTIRRLTCHLPLARPTSELTAEPEAEAVSVEEEAPEEQPAAKKKPAARKKAAPKKKS